MTEKSLICFLTRGSGNLEAIQILKKLGGAMTDSYLEEGFLLNKKVGLNQPQKMENCKGRIERMRKARVFRMF